MMVAATSILLLQVDNPPSGPHSLPQSIIIHCSSFIHSRCQTSLLAPKRPTAMLLRLVRKLLSLKKSTGARTPTCESSISGLVCFALHQLRLVTMGMKSGLKLGQRADQLIVSHSMMMNSSQQMDRWTNYFNKPDDNRLGIMNNAYNIGSIVSFFLV